MPKIIGVFDNRVEAENAVRELQGIGLANDVSLVTKEGAEENEGFTRPQDSLADGTATGSFIGGIAGLALGAGSLIIPGIGPIIAAGPIAGIISGALAGGVAGAFIDYGIPAEHSEEYAKKVHSGNTVAIVNASNKDEEAIIQAFNRHGVEKVEAH